MGKSAPSPPPAPDPAATAAAQGAINKETAIAQARLNQVNEYTPYGSSIYEKTGNVNDGIDQMKRTTTLDPAQQAIVDNQNTIDLNLSSLAGEQLDRVSTNLAQPYSYDSLVAAPAADAAARQQAIDAMYGQYTSRLDPRFAEEQTAAETSLATQGIGVGSDAYTKAMESFGRTKNDAYTSAMNQAVSSGGAEQSRLFGLAANARERAIQEQATLRNAPLNEITALTSGQLINNPQFAAMGQTPIAAADITGPTRLAYQGQMAGYDAQNAQRLATTEGLYGLGRAGITAYGASGSDIRIKENISRVGTLDNGLPVYSFRYKAGGPQQIGLMAQDVEKVNPMAVTEINGVKAVYYSEAVK